MSEKIKRIRELAEMILAITDDLCPAMPPTAIPGLPEDDRPSMFNICQKCGQVQVVSEPHEH